MKHHISGGHAHGPHNLAHHLPGWCRVLGSIVIVCLCVQPIMQGLAEGNPFGLVLWIVIADLLCKFVWTWS